MSITKKVMVHQEWIANGGNDARLTCPCGERVWLHFNGGELDSSKCKCGRFFYNETPLIQYWMEEPEAASE